ncbi:unnamed protein product, partial [Gongylonema pulchrum]|uniref:Pecanex-like protein n=1 Tax=Gongylonema pulchrum TaxID=637853 RepID=A0A183EEQ0_9BILA
DRVITLEDSFVTLKVEEGEGEQEIFIELFCLIFIGRRSAACSLDFCRDERADFKLPRDLAEAKRLGLVLSKYKDRHYYTVLLGISTMYIVLQSLAIPGSIFLTCSASGAQICYFFARFFGRKRILAFAPETISKWQNELSLFNLLKAFVLASTVPTAFWRTHVQRGFFQIAAFDSLFYCIIFLRITPILPNWLINVASPVFDVPVTPFFFGTFIGKQLTFSLLNIQKKHGLWVGHAGPSVFLSAR